MHWLPAGLSIARVPLAFVLVVTYRATKPWLYIAIAIFALAALSDKLDGALARRLGVASYGGYLLDGLADRTFSVACLIVGTLHHHLPVWVMLLAILRELLLYTIRLMTPSWHPPSQRERRHSLLFFGVSRAWFLAVLIVATAEPIVGDMSLVMSLLHLALSIAVAISTYSLGETLFGHIASWSDERS